MTTEQTSPNQDDNQIITERRAKLAGLRKEGVAFPNDFERKHLAGDLHTAYGAMSHDELETAHVSVTVAGGMMLKRVMGKDIYGNTEQVRICHSRESGSPDKSTSWMPACAGMTIYSAFPYMKMVSGGVGFGLVVKDFRGIFVFSTAKTLQQFTESGWAADAQADAAAKAGEKGGAAAGAITVAPGVDLYQLTENGLALQATIQGTKYYKDDDLNGK